MFTRNDIYFQYIANVGYIWISTINWRFLARDLLRFFDKVVGEGYRFRKGDLHASVHEKLDYSGLWGLKGGASSLIFDREGRQVLLRFKFFTYC